MRNVIRVGIAASLVIFGAESQAAAPLVKDTNNFDVCINAADFLVTDADHSGGFTAGDTFMVVGIVLPSGTIPVTGAPPYPDGLGGFLPECNQYQNVKIGRFAGGGGFLQPAPAGVEVDSADYDFAYIYDRVRLDGVGELQWSGVARNGSSVGPRYPVLVTGGSGKYKATRGEAFIENIAGSGFQVRVHLPVGSN